MPQNDNHCPTPRYRRIVVKAGTSVLTGGTDRLDLEIMTALVGQIARLHAQGVEAILVTSGAIAAGRDVLGIGREERRGVPLRQVMAAIGQSRLMHAYEQLFGWHGISVAQALITRHDLEDRQGYLNVGNTLRALLEHRVVPVVNENDVVAVEEIGEAVFGDNDNLSALVANLVDADLLAILTDTGGLYTADPHQDPESQLIRRVERVDAPIEALAAAHRNAVSRGGMPAKLEAARLATASGIAVIIADGRERDVLLRIAEGQEVGTFFVPTATRLESRKRWMLSGLASSGGEIVVDSGAVAALRKQNRSLLAAGVRGVWGEFQRGDVVYIVDGGGQRVACGIANYSSQEVQRIQGARSDRIAGLLGRSYGAEVVHRNNMVLL
ncbi:MAG: glutamate 5-kinase [Chloroflexi bacterium]|nr:glutamate 5-kinase [Chloroflexota bacterium]